MTICIGKRDFSFVVVDEAEEHRDTPMWETREASVHRTASGHPQMLGEFRDGTVHYRPNLWEAIPHAPQDVKRPRDYAYKLIGATFEEVLAEMIQPQKEARGV